jgi:protocatechuate 3,4-dioxygenase beta subunit
MGITIHVQNTRTNNFATGAKVTLSDSVGQRKATTNSSGDASFPTAKPGTYTVYVEGRQVYSGPITGVKIVEI